LFYQIFNEFLSFLNIRDFIVRDNDDEKLDEKIKFSMAFELIADVLGGR